MKTSTPQDSHTPSQKAGATTMQVAERFLVSEQSVRRWARSGRIPAYRTGSQFRFDLADVEEALRFHGDDDE